MNILKSILHRWNPTSKEYDTLHPETESACVTDWHAGIMNSLASKTLGTAVNALTTDSVFGKLVKLLLTASGVKYNIAQNGYVCLGSFFGGLIIQWGCFAIPDNSYYGDFTLPIAFATRVYVVTAIDVLVASNTSIETLPPLTWSMEASTNTKFRLVTSKPTLSAVNAVIFGK